MASHIAQAHQVAALVCVFLAVAVAAIVTLRRR